MKRKIYFLIFALCLGAAANYVQALTVSPTEFLFVSNTGDTRKFTMYGTVNNEGWIITPNVDWITVSETSGIMFNQYKKEITVTVKQNLSSDARDGLIIIHCGNSYGTQIPITVHQEGPPSLTVSPTTLNFKSSASYQKFNVTSNGSLDLRSNDPTWLTVSPMTSTGSGAATATVIANTLTTERIGTITITRGTLKQTVTVIQAGVPFLTVTTNKLEFAYSSSMIPFGIKCNTDWTITNDSGGWVSVAQSSGNDNATINVTVSANTSSTSRTATITVTAGTLTQKITVNQAAYIPSLTVSPASPEFTASGGSKTITVTSNTDWTITKNIGAWCTVSSSGGSGSETLTITVTTNTLATQRVGYLYFDAPGVPRQTVTVTQVAAAVAPAMTVSPEILDFPASAGMKSFNITSNTDWLITNNSGGWVTVSSTWGNGGTTINVNVSANTSSTERKATITVTAGTLIQKVEVTQAGTVVTPPPTLTVEPTLLEFNASGGSKTFTVTSNTTYSISSNATWATLPVIYYPNSPITVTVSPSLSARTAIITVTAGTLKQEVTIKQEGAVITPRPTLTVTPSSLSIPSTANQYEVDVSSNNSWTVESNATWLSIVTTSGINNGKFKFDVTANPSTIERPATITVTAGGLTQTVTVTQAGVAVTPTPTLTVSPSLLEFTASAGSKSFGITSNSSWTVESSAPAWATVSSSSGNSDKTITVTATANPSSTPRTATITVKAGALTQTVTVAQAGVEVVTPSPTMSFSLSNLTFSPSSDEQSFVITSNIDWDIACNASWVTVTPTSGSNNEVIKVTVTANTTSAPRNATITVSGTGVASQTTTVTQSYTFVGNENITSPPLTAYTQNGVLYVTSLTQDVSLRVYGITGGLVASSNSSEGGEFVLPLPGRGVYIVSDGKSVVKVVN